LKKEPVIDVIEPTEIKLKTLNAEKRILLGAVLIPDKLILRKVNGQEFNIVFDKETIRLSMENFARQGYHNNSTIEHDEAMKLSNVSFVEMWIKEDLIHDKSAMYGLEEPVGTMYAALKVNDDKVWEDYVKTGKVKGFSIDGFFEMEKINLNKFEMSVENEQTFIDKIIAGVKLAFSGKPVEVNLGSMTANNGELTFNFEGDMVTAGTTVLSMKLPDGTDAPVPDGEYMMEDGTTWVVAGSIPTEVKPATADQAPAAMGENPQAAPASAPVIKSEKQTSEVFYQLATTLGQEMETKLAAFKAEIMEAIESKTESVSLTKAKPEQPEEEPKTAKERLARKLNNSKTA